MNPKDLLDPSILGAISSTDLAYLTEIFESFDGLPTIEQIWRLMDDQWDAFDCDPQVFDDRIESFYRHPVWLLNGLFVEHHAESIQNRHRFTNWVVDRQPSRVADFGGGFGGLARLIGASRPATQVEVVDPHPHPAAIALADSTPNVRFVSSLSGKYDVLIATDVFEHVPDPIGLVAETATYLRDNGEFLIANCFQPVIKCHLPQLFHLDFSWDRALKAMGLEPGESVAYGRSYRRIRDDLSLSRARSVERCAAKVHKLLPKIPKGRNVVAGAAMGLLCW